MDEQASPAVTSVEDLSSAQSEGTGIAATVDGNQQQQTGAGPGDESQQQLTAAGTLGLPTAVS